MFDRHAEMATRPSITDRHQRRRDHIEVDLVHSRTRSKRALDHAPRPTRITGEQSGLEAIRPRGPPPSLAVTTVRARLRRGRATAEPIEIVHVDAPDAADLVSVQ